MAIIGQHLSFGDSDGNVVADSRIENNQITFGNGNSDVVKSSNGELFGATITGNTITFGNGSGDAVTGSSMDPLGLDTLAHNQITFGDGSGDAVTDTNVDLNQITFGNCNGDVVRFAESADRNKITFGNGNGDEVVASGNDHAAIGGTLSSWAMAKLTECNSPIALT